MGTRLLLLRTTVMVTGVLMATLPDKKTLLIPGLAKMVVGSLVPLLLAAAVASLPPETVAKLVVDVASALTPTVTAMGGQAAPALSPSLRLQSTVRGRTIVQPQPAPVAVTGAMLVGSVSDTVTVPKVLPLPWLVTCKL